MSKLNELITKHEEMKAEFQRQAQDLFKELAREFWDKNPALTAVKWAQYTPYFNDGDACVFGIGEVVFTNAPVDELDEVSVWGEYEGEAEGIFAVTNIGYVLNSDSKYYDRDRKYILALGDRIDAESIEEFGRAVCKLDEVMLAMFGDHVQVTMTREGFDVEDYEHD